MTENWNETQKLLASDGAASDYFGPCFLDGDTAIISSYTDDDKGLDSGSAYTFTRTGTNWIQEAKLLASDGAPYDYFGYYVALSGDTALIGAPYDDDNGDISGSAYVFTRAGTTWTQEAKLLAHDGAASDYFGIFVSIYGDTALIGAAGDDGLKGSAYVFIRTGTTWTEQAKLVATDGAAGDQFGGYVSLYDDTALIGALFDDDNGVDSGSAYVFTRTGTTWNQEAKLLASDGETGEIFGNWVSLYGNTALIAAGYDDDNGIHAGSAYVFTRTGTTWNQEAKLLASDGAAGDQFGCSVSLSGDTALIGANWDDDKGDSSGSAYVFTHTGTTWNQEVKLLASDGAAGDWFGGYNVCLDGDTAFIGADHDNNVNGVDSGSLYVFLKKPENQPPEKPTITGPAKGKAKFAVEYNFTTSDPEGDEVSYFIEWGDGTNSSWVGPYPSGDVIKQSHTWAKKGTYIIKAKVKDIYGNESGWGTLTVTMPYSYSYNVPMQWILEKIFERFPHAFPILRYLWFHSKPLFFIFF